MAYKSLITQVKNAGTIEKLVSGTPAQICRREDFRLHTVSLVPIFSSCSFSHLAPLHSVGKISENLLVHQDNALLVTSVIFASPAC